MDIWTGTLTRLFISSLLGVTSTTTKVLISSLKLSVTLNNSGERLLINFSRVELPFEA